MQEAFDAEKPAEEEVPATAAEEKMETEAVAAEETAKAETMETGEAAAKTEETPAEGKPAENKTEAKVEEKKEEEKGTKRKADEEPPFEVKENEPEIPEALVCLDWYNSDLNLRITDNYMTGIPFSRLVSHHLYCCLISFLYPGMVGDTVMLAPGQPMVSTQEKFGLR